MRPRDLITAAALLATGWFYWQDLRAVPAAPATEAKP